MNTDIIRNLQITTLAFDEVIYAIIEKTNEIKAIVV